LNGIDVLNNFVLNLTSPASQYSVVYFHDLLSYFGPLFLWEALGVQKFPVDSKS